MVFSVFLKFAVLLKSHLYIFMLISIIVGVGRNNEIGCNNDLLWKLPADMKHFKEITTGHSIVMGRKTFESLPKGALPNRVNIVLSRNKAVSFNNCLVFSSIEEVVGSQRDTEELFIIGGSEVYKQTISLADKLYLTRVDAEFDNADTFFPEIDYSEWKEISREEHFSDENNPYNYTFLELERKNYSTD